MHGAARRSIGLSVRWRSPATEPFGRSLRWLAGRERHWEGVMSHSLIAADRSTHIRIVTVALIAVIVFVTALIAAQIGNPDSNMVAANAPTVVKAEKATNWTNRETTGAVR